MGLESTGHLNAQAAVRRLRMDDVTFTFIADGAMSRAPHVFIKTAPPAYWAQHPEWFCDPDINPAAVPKARQRLLDEPPRDNTVGFAVHFGDQQFGTLVGEADTLAWRRCQLRCCFHRPELYNRSSSRHSNPAASAKPNVPSIVI